MPRDNKCIGERIENEIDGIVNEIEKNISSAKGMGSVSDDKYDEMMNQITIIREGNDKLKCMIESIPKSEVHLEEIMEEVKSGMET